MLTVASVIDPLRAANRLSGHDLFTWKVYATSGTTIRLTGGVELTADGVFDDVKGGDVFIAVASFNQKTNAPATVIQNLSRVASRFRVVCGVEAGTWLLARAGLANGHKVTTHWEDLENMARHHARINVQHDRYVIDRKLWTCGGASPALDMMLELIRQQHDNAIALQVASVFIYDQTHASTDPQTIHSLGAMTQKEPRVASAVRLMESNIEDPVTTKLIASRLNISVRTLELRFKQQLGKTPGEYYLGIRLTAARKMVLDTPLSIQEISVLSGFSSQSSFSRAFKNKYGTSPQSLRLSVKANLEIGQ